MTTKMNRRIRIKYRIRKKISGTPERPRMSVFRSNKQIYVQVIDDLSGTTLAAASSLGMGTGCQSGCIDCPESSGSWYYDCRIRP